MSQKRSKVSKVFLNANVLTKDCVIGCTVLPSQDDPKLQHGVALTVLNAHDRKYVKFEDIDKSDDGSYRYWKDVFLIIAWNDKNYKPLKPGDSVFALFENPDKTLTTIYFKATIKQLPSSSNGNQVIIDYDGDESNEYVNIPIRQFTQIPTKTGTITAPTVIRRICAENTKQFQIALKTYENRKKPKQQKQNKSNSPKKSPKKTSASPKKASSSPSKSKYNYAYKPPQPNTTNLSKSESMTPLKKSTKRVKKQHAVNDSDSDSPIITKPKPRSKQQNVQKKQIINSRKRKYSEMNTKNATQNMPKNVQMNKSPITQAIAQQPPLKRQRSSSRRRGAQKLKIKTPSPLPAQSTQVQKSHISSKVIPKANEKKNMNPPPPSMPNAPPQIPKKRMIKFKNKSKNKPKVESKENIVVPPKNVKKEKKMNILAPPPPMPSVPEIPMTSPPIRPNNVRIEKVQRIQQVMPKTNVVQTKVQKQSQPQPQTIYHNPRKKFRRIWGDYDVDMPMIDDGFKLFGDDEKCLNGFDEELKKLMISKENNLDSADCFVSGLGIKHKWIEPKEIGEITVGPYVVDIAIHDELL